MSYKTKRAAENAIDKQANQPRAVAGATATRCGPHWHAADPEKPLPVKGGKPDRWTRVEWDTATMTLWARCRDRCELATCGESLGNRVERHHRQRRQVGGDRIANLVALHPECHAWAHAHPEEARRLGVIVSASEPDPATVPLELAGGERVLLDDLGTYLRPVSDWSV